MVTEIGRFESPDLTMLDFGSWGWMKSKVYKRKVDTWDELFALILDLLPAYSSMKINLDEQQTIFAHKLRIALKLMVDCLNIEVDGGLSEHLLWTVTNWLFKH
jgi:hypothetical protein